MGDVVDEDAMITISYLNTATTAGPILSCLKELGAASVLVNAFIYIYILALDMTNQTAIAVLGVRTCGEFEKSITFAIHPI